MKPCLIGGALETKKGASLTGILCTVVALNEDPKSKLVARVPLGGLVGYGGGGSDFQNASLLAGVGESVQYGWNPGAFSNLRTRRGFELG